MTTEVVAYDRQACLLQCFHHNHRNLKQRLGVLLHLSVLWCITHLRCSIDTDTTATKPAPSFPQVGWCDLSRRKEVIQPHFPVRLPCYDFTPLTKRTFDVALQYG